MMLWTLSGIALGAGDKDAVCSGRYFSEERTQENAELAW